MKRLSLEDKLVISGFINDLDRLKGKIVALQSIDQRYYAIVSSHLDYLIYELDSLARFGTN